jgi:hypothetical protein
MKIPLQYMHAMDIGVGGSDGLREGFLWAI